jgi:lathosterol oxidase
MDLVLNACDNWFLDDFYSQFPSEMQSILLRDSIYRQSFSLWLIAFVGVNLLYFSLATFSYHFLYDKTLTKHPKFLKDQIWLEIKMSCISFPITAIVTVPWFLFEVRGYSKLYHDNQYGTGWFFLSIVLFILFTDFGVYWIHRFEHHPMLYSWLHKPHHQWKISTPL